MPSPSDAFTDPRTGNPIGPTAPKQPGWPAAPAAQGSGAGWKPPPGWQTPSAASIGASLQWQQEYDTPKPSAPSTPGKDAFGDKAPTYNPEPWRLDTPGAGAQMLQQNWGFYNSPTAASEWNKKFGKKLMEPDANQRLYEQMQASGGGPNNAQAEYNAFGGRRPDIATEPGFASYYDNAQKKLETAMNAQLAARGQYGSGVGLGLLGQAITDLRGEQALKESQYNLDRLAEQRNWTELGGTLARNADISGQDRTKTMSDLADRASTSGREGLIASLGAASESDASELAKKMAGQTAATGVQGAETNRIKTAADQITAAQQDLQSMYQGIWDKYLSGQMTYQDAVEASKVAAAMNASNVASGNADAEYQKGLGTAKLAVDAATAKK